ncbi:NAD(P)-dependent oxidoreductase [Candidatus Pacearchaeota archaeon CG10_big_fil_rev_8_21_14_0_10_34_12]|nr:MAG: NAD(P)-dependent oxidoreductase [Candidatus Pacearchaeota archaeon CG10_big_fil_rev_8_21_14_0_10_34_12]
MEKFLVLGGEGMLGHMVVKYLKSLVDFEVYFTTRNENSSEGIYFDANKNPEKIEEIIKRVNPDVIVNCIGIVVSLVREDNRDMVTFINSYLPHKIANICKANNTKLIHISSDCVFSGKEGGYTENSLYSPIDFYGLTKATGEVNDNHNLTIRTSIIGPEIKEPKTGLMEWFFSQKGKEVKGFTKAIWSGVTTLELAKRIVEMHQKNVAGIINIASQPINKYDLLCLIKKVYNLNIMIEPDDSVISDRSMKTIRKDVNYSVPSHENMLIELKEWIDSQGKQP